MMVPEVYQESPDDISAMKAKAGESEDDAATKIARASAAAAALGLAATASGSGEGADGGGGAADASGLPADLASELNMDDYDNDTAVDAMEAMTRGRLLSHPLHKTFSVILPISSKSTHLAMASCCILTLLLL